MPSWHSSSDFNFLLGSECQRGPLGHHRLGGSLPPGSPMAPTPPAARGGRHSRVWGSAMGVLLPGMAGGAGARRGLTFISITWRFLAKVITNHARVFAVAAVVPADLLLEAVGQGPLAARARHVVQVDGPPSFPEVRHGPRPGGAPARQQRPEGAHRGPGQRRLGPVPAGRAVPAGGRSGRAEGTASLAVSPGPSCLVGTRGQRHSRPK